MACKVDRVVEKYDLERADPMHESIDEGLVSRWKGEHSHEEMGYRSLTDWFNRRILKSVYDDTGRETLGNRVLHDYESLTGEDELLQNEVREDLLSTGIPVDEILDDFVSWGTMRNHLQDCLGASKETTTDATDWERKSIDMARNFAREKVESTVSALGSKGQLAGVDHASVEVQVKLRCGHCPTRVPIGVAIDRGFVCERHRDTPREIQASKQ
ncbi:hypothetical protein AArcSl_2527 [Halalkaliarchaeum desulfuricum]|uniref:Uncharacterized protein n=1 Tax=Halalkaliarchaeum desulfuricum TaxID=2055893 RepID=A0A343TM26_9EURY|nr:rod-determining factor RdfA [Halalkaliarchaeum desulfuricum]AUX10148.1 hypothetical protein AArcSl_2527 [Halalkaliarchaeum desulfuricum]